MSQAFASWMMPVSLRAATAGHIAREVEVPLVLIVDDDSAVRASLQYLLEADGHVVLSAANSDDARTLYDVHRPDIVITDLVMPGKEGIETIIAIRRRGIATKILAMTGSDPADRPTYLDAAHKLGADAVVRKPFRAGELKTLVDGLLAPA